MAVFPIRYDMDVKTAQEWSSVLPQSACTNSLHDHGINYHYMMNPICGTENFQRILPSAMAYASHFPLYLSWILEAEWYSIQ